MQLHIILNEMIEREHIVINKEEEKNKIIEIIDILKKEKKVGQL